MDRVIALDCTLRDGGYCNKWRFKKKNIAKIISGLIAANVEVIECGFLTNRISYDPDVSKFSDISQLDIIVPHHVTGTQFVLMANYGEYDFESLPLRENSCIDGIRLAFHKNKRYDALKACEIIKRKGYLVFMQPMVTMLYSDDEFIELVDMANELEPYAFYLVDSFGMMNKKAVLHYWTIIEKRLERNILIGFHAHNNLQLAYSNALCLLEKESIHGLIIDSSIYGMGRGAGNLNSELFLTELNNDYEKHYEIKPILKVMDDVINRFYEETPWGYSLPNYLSATHMIHPNYAGYLSSKKTLTVEDIDEIFSMITPDKGSEFDEKYVSDLYVKYMSAGVARNEHLFEIKQKAKGRKILIVAPGKNAIAEKEKVLSFITENNPLIISINHEYPVISPDYLFVSNIRRFAEIDISLYGKTVSTSNIKSTDTYASIDYYKLLNTVDIVRDNAGLMAIKFACEELEANDIYIAGLDGYSHDVNDNFERDDLAFMFTPEYLDAVNNGMQEVLAELMGHVNIHFVTGTLLKIRNESE